MLIWETFSGMGFCALYSPINSLLASREFHSSLKKSQSKTCWIWPMTFLSWRLISNWVLSMTDLIQRREIFPSFFVYASLTALNGSLATLFLTNCCSLSRIHSVYPLAISMNWSYCLFFFPINLFSIDLQVSKDIGARNLMNKTVFCNLHVRNSDFKITQIILLKKESW